MIEKQAFAIWDELVSIRRALHKIPELCFQEFQTSALIQKALKSYGIPFQVIAKTGVAGLITGGRPGKTILLRADIDALPIQEESGVSYASEHPGYMHACGHDVHTACLLGAAKILNAMKNDLPGNIKLIFQPAEEGEGGALPMIEAGVMENPHVDAAFALHVEPLAETGTLQFKTGSIMASPDDFEFTVYGKGGHGGNPHKCVDPILTAAMIINNMQSVVSRNINPMTPCAVSVCAIHGGNCHNVIPDSVQVLGTARSLDPGTRKLLATQLENVAVNTAAAMGARCAFTFSPLFPPVINDQAMTKLAADAAAELDCVREISWLEEASMAGDDFAYFIENTPGAYFKLGVGNRNGGICEPIHSAKFQADESALPIGAAVLANIAYQFLNS